MISRIYAVHLSPGFVKSYTALVSLRAFLGLIEGPMAPGIALYLSSFYTRKELSFRYVFHGKSLFWCRPGFTLIFKDCHIPVHGVGAL